MNTKQPRKVFTIGTDQYVLPLTAGGFYVSDRNGRTVLEAQSFEAAKALAAMLNQQAQKYYMTEPEMPSLTHVVRIHPMESGELNLRNVVKEFEYNELESAENCIEHWNETAMHTKAIYSGCFNNETGDMV